MENVEPEVYRRPSLSPFISLLVVAIYLDRTGAFPRAFRPLSLDAGALPEPEVISLVKEYRYLYRLLQLPELSGGLRRLLVAERLALKPSGMRAPTATKGLLALGPAVKRESISLRAALAGHEHRCVARCRDHWYLCHGRTIDTIAFPFASRKGDGLFLNGVLSSQAPQGEVLV